MSIQAAMGLNRTAGTEFGLAMLMLVLMVVQAVSSVSSRIRVESSPQVGHAQGLLDSPEAIFVPIGLSDGVLDGSHRAAPTSTASPTMSPTVRPEGFVPTPRMPSPTAPPSIFHANCIVTIRSSGSGETKEDYVDVIRYDEFGRYTNFSRDEGADGSIDYWAAAVYSNNDIVSIEIDRDGDGSIDSYRKFSYIAESAIASIEALDKLGAVSSRDRFAYSPVGQMVELTRFNRTDDVVYTEQYQYHEDSLIGIDIDTDGDGKIDWERDLEWVDGRLLTEHWWSFDRPALISYRYDRMGRYTGYDMFGDSPVPLQREVFKYGDDGWVSSHEFFYGSDHLEDHRVFTYDALDRLLQVRFGTGGVWGAVWDYTYECEE